MDYEKEYMKECKSKGFFGSINICTGTGSKYNRRHSANPALDYKINKLQYENDMRRK